MKNDTIRNRSFTPYTHSFPWSMGNSSIILCRPQNVRARNRDSIFSKGRNFFLLQSDSGVLFFWGGGGVRRAEHEVDHSLLCNAEVKTAPISHRPHWCSWRSVNEVQRHFTLC
jgi:hypothetical protein